MGKILGAYLMPHPPIIMHEIGQGKEYEVNKTISSMEKIATEIKELKPDTIVVITPHGPVFQDAITIGFEEELLGDMGRFGHPDLKIKKKNDIRMAEKLIEKSGMEGIQSLKLDDESSVRYSIDAALDHGVQVPLYFVEKEYQDYNLLHITYGMFSFIELYRFGMILSGVIHESDDNVVIISSGDLSHKLKDSGPYEFHPDGPKFDRELLDLLSSGDYAKLIKMDNKMRKNAGECGLRSIEILLGAIDGYHSKPEVLSYEGSFGVGYGVVNFHIGDRDENMKIFRKIEELLNEEALKSREGEDAYIKLARESLEYYIATGYTMEVPQNLPKELTDNRAGVFVTIHKEGVLRGCIGTISPYRNSIADEIIHNAISAGTKDSRFDSVTESELADLEYSVDVLMEAEKISSVDELDTKKYGVIVASGYRRGLLLPNLEGIDSVEQQVEIAMRKAGIREGEEVELERFEVVRHE